MARESKGLRNTLMVRSSGDSGGPSANLLRPRRIHMSCAMKVDG